MISARGALLAGLVALNFGGVSSKVLQEQSESPFAPLKFNVYYDLACLNGDSDGDGILTDSEYKNFDINALAPKAELMEDTSFKFVGFLPVDESNMVFYVFTKADVSANSVFIKYVNGVMPSADGSCYTDDILQISTAHYLSEYKAATGYFSKFVIENYVPKSYEGDMRVSAKSVQVYKGVDLEVEYECNGDGAELYYNESNAYSKNAVSTYFGSKTYGISGDAYMNLFITGQVSEDYHIFFVPIAKNVFTTEAKEVTYFFFSFDDTSFRPDEITSVSYSCQLRTYEQTSYYCCKVDTAGLATTITGSNEPRIYGGLFADSDDGLLDFFGKKYEYSNETKSVKTVNKTVSDRVEEIRQIDTMHDVWAKHQPIISSYRLSTMVDVDSYETDFQGAAYEPFRTFIKSSIDSGKEDGKTYQFAYAIEDDSWVRSVSSNEIVDGQSSSFGQGSTVSNVSKCVSECHEPDQIVTLFMHTVTDGVGNDIKVFNNPASVKKVFMTGNPAPSLFDFVSNDISTWFKQQSWIWIVVAVLAVILLSALAAIFPPIFNAIGYLFKGLIFVFKLLIELLYFVLVWWWLAIVRKGNGEDVPPLWLWGKE